ncbi:MAG: ATP phosphoribosyltransferase regulatory subunit, partial [Pseudomonadota bacterium]
PGRLSKKRAPFTAGKRSACMKAMVLPTAADAAAPPLGMEEKAMIEAVLQVAGSSTDALEDLRAIAPPPMVPALDAFERRLEALAARGVEVAALAFDAAFGRRLEYYDGFVFEFRSPDPALPPLGGGGRYDALTAVLGASGADAGDGGSVAIGGMVRPEAMLAAEDGA